MKDLVRSIAALTVALAVCQAQASSADNCALGKVLSSAKEVAAKEFGNRTMSRGVCALGVRMALQASGIGNVHGSLGNAADFVRSLAKHGFKETSSRDLKS